MEEELNPEVITGVWLPAVVNSIFDALRVNEIEEEYSLPEPNSHNGFVEHAVVNHEDASIQSMDFKIMSEVPDMQCGVKSGNDDIKLEHLVNEELHIKNEIDESFVDQTRKTEVKHFYCDLCNNKFTSKKNLQQHQNDHTQEKSLQCNISICDYNSIQKDNLQEHIKTRTAEKPFKCSLCDYRCIRKSYLLQHKKTHSEKQPINDIVCILLETPLSTFKDEDKKEVLHLERSAPTLAINKTVRNKGQSYSRNFKNIWYEQYQWLCGSHYLQKLFCWPCLLVSKKKGIWNKFGFGDFLNVTRALHNHEGSSEHIKCAISFKQLKKNTNIIADALEENTRLYIIKFNENVQLNRRFMELPIDAVLYLGKQELAFRGDDCIINSLNGGNFKELLKFFVKRSPVDIRNHYEKIKAIFSGDSKIIQNEIICCVSEYIEEAIAKEIEETFVFAVQVDDTTDVAQKSQSCIILRYVNASGKLVERFFGFYDVSADRTAETLFNLLHFTLERYNYKSKLIAQCYDGANVMSGHLNDLQAKIKEVAPQAVFVHCLAHYLNLVLQQTVTKISKCRIFFATISGLPSFCHHSVKRTYVADSVIGRRIPTVAQTGWSSNLKILNVIMTEWNGLKEIFEQIINDPSSNQTSIRQSEGFLNKFNDFEFTFLVFVFNEIFELSNILFDVLQNESLNISYCLSQIKIVCEKFKSKKNEKKYREIFHAASLKSTIVQRRQPQSKDQIFQSHKILYYEILDTILMEMDTRFKDMEKLFFISLADISKFAEYSKKFPTENLNNLKKNYPNLFSNMEINRLKNELEIIYADQQYRDKNLQEVIQLLHENHEIFKETYKLFCLILTIPSTSSSIDSFSCLKRIKTYLHNSVSQERLLSLGRISIEQELLLELQTSGPFYDDIINKFASLKDRGIDLIYKH